MKRLHIPGRIRRYMCGRVTREPIPIWAKALTDVVNGHSCWTATGDSNMGTGLSNQASAQGP